METPIYNRIKGYVEEHGESYFPDSFVLLKVEDGININGTEDLVVGNKDGSINSVDSLIKDIFLRRNIEIEGERTEFPNNYKNNIAKKIFGLALVERKGIIKVDSHPKYKFYSIERIKDIRSEIRASRLEEIK